MAKYKVLVTTQWTVEVEAENREEAKELAITKAAHEATPGVADWDVIDEWDCERLEASKAVRYTL